MRNSRRLTRAGAVIVASALLAGCGNSQFTTPSSGSASGTTLHISIVDDVTALIGGEILGSSSSGFDRIDGDLFLKSPGRWEGTVTGRAEREIEVIVLDDHCAASLEGTQQLEVVATKGSFDEGRNLRLVLSPLSPPSYTTYPDCAKGDKETAANGIEWLWFYLDSYKDAGMEIKLPASTGAWTWEFNPNPNPGYAGGCGDFEFLNCEHTTTVTVEYR